MTVFIYWCLWGWWPHHPDPHRPSIHINWAVSYCSPSPLPPLLSNGCPFRGSSPVLQNGANRNYIVNTEYIHLLIMAHNYIPNKTRSPWIRKNWVQNRSLTLSDSKNTILPTRYLYVYVVFLFTEGKMMKIL